ncbi:DHA2 family efflux MFS transporter permease subunit [Thermincola ferriacetica]
MKAAAGHTNAGHQDNLYKWLALIVVVVGTFMAILDTSIVNIAIPKMMNVFGVSTDQIQWVITAYMLTMGPVIPLTGYLSDTFGTKKMYIWALGAFTVGSALCGFAWSNSAMIVARIIQALGGGMIMPISMSIIYQVIPAKERGMALGIWGIAAMAAPAIGPTLSGYIVEHLNWRLIFTINIPVGIIGVILAGLLLKESPRKPSRGFDYLGFVSSTVGLVSILYVLGEGSTIDWNEFKNVFLLVLGIFSLMLFAANELTRDDPLLDLRVLKIWPYTLSIIISSITNIALFGGVFLLPLFFQNLQGYSAMQTGLIMFPGAVATGIMMPVGGKLFDKFGAKPVVIPGLLILMLSTYQLSRLTLDTNSHTVMWLMAVRGVGLGLAMMPITTAGMNSVPSHLVARASALQNVIRQVAGSVGITILTTIMTNRQAVNYIRLAEQVSYFDANSVELFGRIQGWLSQQGVPAGEAQGISVSTVFGLVAKEAAVQAINDTLFVTVLIILVTIPLALLMRGKKSSKQKDEHLVMFE